MGKLIRLGATALSMIGILVMILCVQAAILFVRLCIRRKTVILLAFFSVSNPIAFLPGQRYNEKQAKKW